MKSNLRILSTRKLTFLQEIEDGISTRTRLAFEKRLDIQDFQTGLSIEKINEIDKYFSERI